VQRGLTAHPLLVLFAKAPVSGTVKTRLARTIGDAAALEFHRHTLEQTVSRLRDQPGWNLLLAVTPDDAPECLWPGGIAREGQGDGDLGQRIGRLLARARPHAPVAIVGSDIPALDTPHVVRAFDLLRTHDLVLGPASDGGYWLIGAAAPPPACLFDAVRWSSAHTRADTLANASGLRVGLADLLDDVDDATGYARWRGRA
jgi:rSAM/selenodomain-associated transferase 1